MIRDLARVGADLEGGSNVRVVVFESANRDFFIAHVDVVLIQALPTEVGPKPTELGFFHQMVERFRTLPQVTIGKIEGRARGGGTQRLPRLVGRGRALEIILGCEDFDAELAERYGYINRALPAGDLSSFVDRLARRIASFPPEAIVLAKASVDAAELPTREGLLEESHAFQRSLASRAARERIAAFLSAGGQTPEMELNLGGRIDMMASGAGAEAGS